MTKLEEIAIAIEFADGTCPPEQHRQAWAELSRRNRLRALLRARAAVRAMKDERLDPVLAEEEAAVAALEAAPPHIPNEEDWAVSLAVNGQRVQVFRFGHTGRDARAATEAEAAEVYRFLVVWAMKCGFDRIGRMREFMRDHELA